MSSSTFLGRKSRPTVEALEARQLLTYTTLGGTWSQPARVTYSILPDGTSFGGNSSNLQATLPTGWLTQIEKAAAQWEDAAKVNVVYQSTDGGQAIGISGSQQGDSRFGDIRIGGYTQSAGILAFAYEPPPFNGGTNAGDIAFNTNQSWQTNGTTYDVQTVAAHEFGHALGLGHSTTTTAAMYSGYHSLTSQLITSDDIAGMQAVFGTWSADPYETVNNNNSSTRAYDVTSLIDGNLQVRIGDANNSALTDTDWYKVTVPAGTNGTFTTTVQSSNLSSLVPEVTVYNSSLVSQGNVTSTLIGDTITVTVSGVTANQVYYVKEMPGTTGPGHTGSYGLLLNFGGTAMTAISPPNTTVASQADQGGGSLNDVMHAPHHHHPVGPMARHFHHRHAR